MPFMEEDSNDSDGSSQYSGVSPQSSTTDATSIVNNCESRGCQKRKRNAVDLLPRKSSKLECCSDEITFQMRTDPGGTTARLPCMPPKDEMPYPTTHSSPFECGSLPTLVWTSVFMYLPPKSLGTLLSVNTVFHRLLTGSSPMPEGGYFPRDAVHKDVENIWKMARQRHHPHLPRPLHGYRELDMWKLIGASQCQFCVQSLESPSQYALGPHLTSQKTTIYWPLAVRSCQNCLGKHFWTESELLSSQLSYLISSMNYASVQVLLPPMSLRTRTKVFLRSHLEWLHAETSKITLRTSMATAESWLKTYEMNARKRQRDAARWERWEATNGRVKLFPKSRRQILSGASSPASSCRSAFSPPTEDLTTQSPTSMNSTVACQEARSKKATRVQELIKRAAELDPPIPLKVLRHTPAYQVAQHLTNPLKDFEWSVLRVRLERERLQAETLAQAELSESPSSHRSDTSTMSKNKNKNKRRKIRLQVNKNQDAPSIIATNAWTTGDAKTSVPIQSISGASTGTDTGAVTASMLFATFNQPWQRIVASNGTQQPVVTSQTSSASAAPSTAKPLTTASNMSGSLNRAAPHTSTTGPTFLSAQSTRYKVMASVAAAEILNPKVYRQSSTGSQAIKIESDELEPRQASRTDHLGQHVYRPEAGSLRQLEACRRLHYYGTQYHDRPRSRSRSPPSQQRCLIRQYREHDYPQVRRNILSTYPTTATEHAAPNRGGHESFYDYPVQLPTARHAPHVLYDGYGNEYMRTAPRESTPHILYPPLLAREF